MRLGKTALAHNAITAAEGSATSAALPTGGEEVRFLNSAASIFEREGLYDEAAKRLRKLVGLNVLDDMTAADVLLRALGDSARLSDKTAARADLTELEGRTRKLQVTPGGDAAAKAVVLRKLADAIQSYGQKLGH